MTGFTNATDIANRALQRLGSRRIAAGALLTETSKQASEAAACYDKLRLAELRRNIWRFATRRVLLRAVGTALPAWDSTVTYVVGSLVSYNSVNYVSIHATNLDKQPDTQTTYWSVFIGNTSEIVTPPAYAALTAYVYGNIVTGSDGAAYLAVASTTGNDPTTDSGENWQLYFGSLLASAYASTTSYGVGEIVFDNSNLAYYSTFNGNQNVPATGPGWVVLTGATLAPVVIPWPAGTGPATDTTSRNVFMLPNGFLREAPQDPRAGDYSSLGFPSYITMPDWEYEGNFIVSNDTGPILYRFVADVTMVTAMDPMFCEGLACRIALELCEILTNSTAKLRDIASEYKQFMGEARTVNGIEIKPVQPYLDDFIACRA